MMDAAHEVLRGQGVRADRIAEERFTHPEQRHSSLGSRDPQSVRFVLGGLAREVEVAPGQTLLEAALQAGVDLPFSCAMGGCGACRVRRVEGEVEMDEPNCLSRAERSQGYVLTCIGRPLCAARLHVEDA
jgi:ring-1,2-phenylacetyl-CoA epoxidase subunit PaaE